MVDPPFVCEPQENNFKLKRKTKPEGGYTYDIEYFTFDKNKINPHPKINDKYKNCIGSKPVVNGDYYDDAPIKEEEFYFNT